MAQEAHAYDLIMDGKGLIVVRDGRKPEDRPDVGTPRWNVESIPAEAQETIRIADVPAGWQTWHLGYGYGESSVPGCYHWGTNVDCRWPGVVLLGPLVTTIATGGSSQVSDIFIEGSEIFCLAGRYCYHIKSDDTVDTITGTGSTGKDFGSGAVATKAIDFQALHYIGFSSATNAYSFDGSTWTQSAAGQDVRVLYWAKEWLDSQGWRLLRGYGTNSVQYCAPADDPLTAASWGPSTAWTAGDTSTGITGMVSAHANRVYVSKTNGLHGLDNTGRNDNVLQPLEWQVHANNGKGAIYDGSGVLYPHAQMGLLRYDESTGAIKSEHPGDRTGNRSAIRGVITAQCLVGPWHYALLYNGTDSYLMAGRYPTDGEQLPEGWVGPKIWHPLATLTGVQCDCLRPSGLTDPPRLYFGHGANVAYIKLPKSGNVVAEIGTGNLTFASSGSLYLSPETWGARGTPKELMGFELENESVSVNNPISVYVALDGGGWQLFGRAQVAGRSSLYLPAGNWRGHRVEYRLDLTNSSSTTTLKVKPLVAKASLTPVIRQLVTTTVWCQDRQRRRDGHESNETGQALLEHLQDLQEQGPITLSDWWTGSKADQLVKVHRVTPTIVQQKGDSAVGYGAQVVFSIIRSLPTSWSWGDGTIWGGGAKWS